MWRVSRIRWAHQVGVGRASIAITSSTACQKINPGTSCDNHARGDPARPPHRYRALVHRSWCPHFIDSYNASEDVLTRTLPFLIVAFLFSSISAIDLDWPAWRIVGASLTGLLLLLVMWAGLNRLRGIRPLLQRPERVGVVEIAVFLGIPTLLPIIFGWDWTGAVITLATQAAILGSPMWSLATA